MDVTRSSLLIRLRDTADNESWREFYALYQPFLLNMARKLGLNDSDADDAVSEVLETCVKMLPTFGHDRSRGFFRGWLKTVMRNKVNDKWRRVQRGGHDVAIDQVGEPQAHDDVWDQWDREYRQRIMEDAMQRVRDASEAKTWNCFEQHILNRRKAGDVARELDVTVSAVYVNASRVLDRIRKHCAEYDEDLLDD